MNEKLTCYMCSKIATNDEHVPPKCFFPSTNDGRYKVNLIKVPSCIKHNNDTSATDELVNILLYLALPNEKNEPAKLQGDKFLNFQSKNTHRKISLLTKILSNNPRIVKLEEIYVNRKGETLVFNYNPLRSQLIETFKKISCGIFFHETKRKLLGSHAILDLIGRSKDPQIDLDKLKIKNEALKLLDKNQVAFKGDNPTVFKYRFFENGDKVLFQFYIYESIEIYNIALKF
ncbi:hypothetical protein [Acinetobacter baumannii]|uniref:hypothetical protein n=1 Tax=Acinetobacter baumannii TaxID=470 RepID=UPI002223DB29|nr:hypothetical protein [Acinetobacter baumannii]MCW1520744.1 hypothetical protein [Acinetobacter baumannii]